MILLNYVKVEGFRAFKEKKKFIFNNPAILLFGENRNGKSSTLNAIEWCLYGNDCLGTTTGIRERVGWEIPNRYCNLIDTSVELRIENITSGEKFKIFRKWISNRKDELVVTLSNGEILQNQEAEAWLYKTIKTSFKDFMTTVYQHQEVIRAVLIQEPRDRNDAIDRLLGLSDYRNILFGIDKGNISTTQRDIGNKFDNFVGKIEITLKTRENDLKDKKREAIQRGLKEETLNEKGALHICNEIKKRVVQFALDTNLPYNDIDIPKNWQDLKKFRTDILDEIDRFRSEMPDVRKQEELYQYRNDYTLLKVNLQQKKENLDINQGKLENIIEKYGNKDVIQKSLSDLEKTIELKTKEMKEKNRKAAVLKEAIDFLKLEGVNEKICPVCGKETTDLLSHLNIEWKERYQKEIGEISDQIDQLKYQQEERNKLLIKYKEYDSLINENQNEIKIIKKKIGNLLGKEVTQKDDPFIIVEMQLKKIKDELKKLEHIIHIKQEILNEITISLDQINLLFEIINQKQKMKIVEQIQRSEEYQKLEKLRDWMAILTTDIENIKQAIIEVSNEEAKQKVSAAGKMIDNYFRIITHNPSVNEIKFKAKPDSKTGRNSYEFIDENGDDIISILNQGDLNALALSIFLAMACSQGTNQSFGFIMMDDPSQSLGSNHKENLVNVLNEVLEQRMIILSSMDKELQDLINSRFMKEKTIYNFDDWTPASGPTIRKG